MNVHETIALHQQHAAALAHLIKHPPTPLPRLFLSPLPYPPGPGRGDGSCAAEIFIANATPYLSIPAPLALNHVPRLIEWLMDIQADVPPQAAHPDPILTPSDPGHDDYDPRPGAD